MMSTLYFKVSDRETEIVTLQEGESVLSGFLRNGVDVPYGCQTGVCQSCMLQSEYSDIPRNAQKGLREVQKNQGYFLSCCCFPQESMAVSLPDEYKKEASVVLDKTMLTDEIVRLQIKKTICYRPGQFVTLWQKGGVARTYSLASHPTQDDYLEFHIRVYDNGVFSPWVLKSLNVGDELFIQGPMGDCFYTAKDKSQTLFLSGLAEGLAPLYGIARDALLTGHYGRVLMLIGARTESGLYYKEELAALKNQFPQFEVRYSVQDMVPELQSRHSREADVYSVARMLIPDLSGAKVFLFGGDHFVRKMKKQCFLSGANIGDIASDTFLRFPM